MRVPKLVAVLNLSPESFYVGSRVNALVAADRMKRAIHAEYVDIGAKSTRPPQLYGENIEVTVKEELRRISEAAELLVMTAEKLGKKLSIDTQSAEVAEIALQEGFTVVNDISGLKNDPDMAEVVARYNADLVIMATKKLPGDCRNMQEVMAAIGESLNIASDYGIRRDKIAIDPGFGGWQGKGSDCDFDILRNFRRLSEFNLPVYVGVSRKSTVKALGGADDPVDRLPGSLALSIWLSLQGVDFIRTHDVEDTYRAIKVWNQIGMIAEG